MDNLFSTVELDQSGSIKGLVTAIENALAAGAQSLCIFACSSNHLPREQLDPYLQRLSVPVFGGLFPGIIYHQQELNRGTLVYGLRWRLPMLTVTDLEHAADNLAQALSESPELRERNDFLVFVDGLSRGIDELLGQLYNQLGPDKQFIGGGAGSLKLKQAPCLFSNRGLIGNAAQIIALPGHLSLGVRHGWKELAGPFLVTEAEGNTIHTLNYKPAYSLYREAIESMSPLRFDQSDFFSIAKNFPLGVERLNEEILIRDPVRVDGSALVCVGQVPDHAMVYLMRGEADNLIAAAEEATDIAKANCRGETVGALLFDCISRTLFLEERFDEELSRVAARLPLDCELAGALTLGEIASSPQGGVHFLNKTLATGLLWEPPLDD